MFDDYLCEYNDASTFHNGIDGTTHKPPPQDTAGFPITEAAAAAKLLIQEVNRPHRLE
jgi:hypothetical protein